MYGKITKSEVLKYIDALKKLNPTSVIYVPTLLRDASGIYSSTEKDPYKDISYVISAKILSVITGSDVKITDLDEDKVIKSIKTIESLCGILNSSEIDPSDGILTNIYIINVKETINKYKNI